jgi:hypothetical protein
MAESLSKSRTADLFIVKSQSELGNYKVDIIANKWVSEVPFEMEIYNKDYIKRSTLAIEKPKETFDLIFWRK